MAVGLFAVEAIQMPRLGVRARVFNYKPYGTNEKFFMVLSSEIPASCISNLRDTRRNVRRLHTKKILILKKLHGKKRKILYVVNYQELSEMV